MQRGLSKVPLGHDASLGLALQVELLKTMVEVMFDSRHTQAKLASNLIREIAADELQDFLAGSTLDRY